MSFGPYEQPGNRHLQPTSAGSALRINPQTPLIHFIDFTYNPPTRAHLTKQTPILDLLGRIYLFGVVNSDASVLKLKC